MNPKPWPSRPARLARLVLSALLALGASLSLGLSGCGPDSRLAGSEVTNPPQKVAGRVRTEALIPAPGTTVQAFPDDFDPIADSAAGLLGKWGDTTDADGAYSIDRLDSGLYNVWGIRSADGTRLLIRDVKADTGGSVSPAEGILHGHGALAILVEDSLSVTNAYVYLEGTPLSYDLHSLLGEAGTVILDSVAAGFTPKLFHKVRGPAGARTLLADNVRVHPGDTVPIGIYRSWRYSKRVFLNTSPTGADIKGPVAEFPLLVRLDSSNFDFSQAREDGADLRFARKDGRPLPYEIESWDKAAAKGLVWVKLESITGGESAQFFRMYWGRSDAVAESNGPAVFTATSHYGGVWHFQGVGSGAPPELQDASAAGNTAYAVEYPAATSRVETMIGKGMRLNGSSGEIYTSKPVVNPGYLTVSLWFRTTTDSGGLLIGFNKTQALVDSATERDRQIWLDSTGRINFGVYVDHPIPAPSDRHVLSSTKICNDGNWHWVAGMISPAGMALYLDGQKIGADPAATNGQNYTGYWRMGFTYRLYDWVPPLWHRYYQGDLDEVRVALQPFAEDWLKLSFENQKPASALLRFEPY